MRLFIGEIYQNEVLLKEEEHHHIVRVLRMKEGDIVYVTNGKGALIKGKLLINGKKVKVQIIEFLSNSSNTHNGLHIAIAPTKNIDRFELFVEKAVELGISKITPLLCTNSERKILNIEKIKKQIETACKQSLRTYFPEICPLTHLKDFIQSTQTQLYLTHCYKEYEKISLKETFKREKEITILVGPEGDFSKKEVEELYSLGSIGVSLGENRLRTETAGIFIASSYYFYQNNE
ncbi:16S rRNA (uracil1498-N3)-methyltransferase [Apibacter mensalis]|uniref:Ribosomal RNA small subunit methyltransferase E n=1 Tax=Apibacter mensalis TaxID=1586267 RepID=A0A0X3AM15_9FLAO|nr:RsmE family RNA methyltransferase [Apibacter mensalis]CVK15386.1 16S rRNA (uracil1498-N3)-methyltransferase [Apibacter mensalis]